MVFDGPEIGYNAYYWTALGPAAVIRSKAVPKLHAIMYRHNLRRIYAFLNQLRPYASAVGDNGIRRSVSHALSKSLKIRSFCAFATRRDSDWDAGQSCPGH